MSSQYGKQNVMDNYVTVAERIEKFYARYPEGRIITSILEHDAERGFILMRADVYRSPDDAQPAATGHAFEYRDSGFVQKTSYIEVCETSSVGRALALCGFEVKRGIASREEMEKQARMTQAMRERVVTAVKEAAPAPALPRVERATADPTSAPADRSERLASEFQKEEILQLFQALRPKDRNAQRQLLVDHTGKQSREELTYTEAARLIERLKEESEQAD